MTMRPTRKAAPTRTLSRLAGAGIGLLAGVGAVVVALPAPAAVAGSVTSTVSAATVNLGVSGTVTDTVTVQGNATYGSPTGSVTFYVCQTGTSQTPTTGPCTPSLGSHFGSALLTSAPNNASTATSAVFTPTGGGTWCFSAVYGGDANYAMDSDNTDNTNLDANECVLVTTDPSTSYSVISAAQVALGPSGTVTDTVTVQGTVAGGDPTGTVDFFACQTDTSQTYNPGPCPNAGSPVDSESLLGGVGDTSSAQSATFTPSAAGTWCFSTVYGGDANYTASSDNTYNGNVDANECVLVTTAPAGATSQISSATITLGPTGTVTDLVTVSGNAAGGSPTGQVTFYVCQISNTQTLTTGPCPAVGNGQATETLLAAPSDTATATSPSFTPTSAGTWCFSATYAGDSNYGSTSDNTTNGNLDSNECVLVGKASTTTTTQTSGNVTFGPSGTATDTVTVTGNSVGGSPSGTVSFYACQTGSTGTQTDGPCAASGTPQSSVALSAEPSDQATTTSTVFTPTAPGTWCFSAVYNGDANYQSSSDNTDNSNLDANECLFVGAVVPLVTTQPVNQTVPLGNLATFSAAASGNPAPTVQWQVSTDGGATYSDIGGAMSTTFSVTMTLANSGYWYRAVFTNFGGSATSNGAGAAVLGGTNVPSKLTALFGNKVVKVHGAGWNAHADSSVSIAQCASSVYSPRLCHTPVTQAVKTSGFGIGNFPGTNLTIVAGIVDSNGDTCGVLGSVPCYIVVTGGVGDESPVAISFVDPAVTLQKSVGVLGNFDNLVHAKHYPIGDTVYTEQCDNTANIFNLGTHCDSATVESAVTGATGLVPFPAGITMRVGSTYSDTAGGVCTGGTTCYIEVIDTANFKVDALVPVTMARPTVVILPTSAATGAKVKVTATGFPIGDGAVTSQCDTAATTVNVSTNCDPSNSLAGTAGTGGVVVWPVGSFGKIPVLSTHGSPLYSDSSSPPATCAPGDTVGNHDPCFVEVHDTANPAIVVLVPLSVTS